MIAHHAMMDIISLSLLMQDHRVLARVTLVLVQEVSPPLRLDLAGPCVRWTTHKIALPATLAIRCLAQQTKICSLVSPIRAVRAIFQLVHNTTCLVAAELSPRTEPVQSVAPLVTLATIRRGRARALGSCTVTHRHANLKSATKNWVVKCSRHMYPHTTVLTQPRTRLASQHATKVTVENRRPTRATATVTPVRPCIARQTHATPPTTWLTGQAVTAQTRWIQDGIARSLATKDTRLKA